MNFYLEIEHLESANVEWNPNKAHGGFFNVNHVFVKWLDVIVVDGYTAGFVQEWKAVTVTFNK